MDLVETPPRDGHAATSPLVRAIRRLASSWRPWMAVPAMLLVVAAAAVAPAPGDVVETADVVTARSVVAVEVPADRTSVATGEYWAPRQAPTASLLRWLAAAAPGGASSTERSPEQVQGLDPLQSAVLMGAGVARGRANAVELGYDARRLSDALPASSLAVSLWTYDAAGDIDLSAGRDILALGTLRPDGSITCPAGSVVATAASLPAPPDLIVVGDCADLDVPSSVEVVLASSLEDALLALARTAQHD